MSDTVMVVQSNALTEGRYDFSLVEKRIIYFIIAEVRDKYIENKGAGQKDLFNDLVLLMPGKKLRQADPNMKRVYESAKALRKRDIEIKTDDIWLDVGFINYAKHNKKTDIIEFGISKEILPHLVELSEKFTAFQLTMAITFTSVYTQRFYELCSQWKNKGYFYKPVDELRTYFKCEEKLKKYADFRINVVEVAYKELKEAFDEGICDLYFEWNVCSKEGKKVVALEFIVKTVEKQKQIQYSLEDYKVFIRAELSSYIPKDKKYHERVMSAIGSNYEMAEQMAEKLTKLKNRYSRADYPKVIRFALQEDFGILSKQK